MWSVDPASLKLQQELKVHHEVFLVTDGQGHLGCQLGPDDNSLILCVTERGHSQKLSSSPWAGI